MLEYWPCRSCKGRNFLLHTDLYGKVFWSDITSKDQKRTHPLKFLFMDESQLGSSSIYGIICSSVASALDYFGHDETQRFVKMFHRFIDCLNVRSMSKSIHSDLRPYHSPDDPRLRVSCYLTVCHVISFDAYIKLQ